MTKFRVAYHTEFGPEVTTKTTSELLWFSRRFSILSITEIVEPPAPIESSSLIRKFEIITNSIVFFEKGYIIEFDGGEYYRINGDQTDRKIHKDIVENVPLWFKEIKLKS